MSYVFDVGESTVWSPALDIGKLYVHTAGQLADILELDTGMTMMANDYWLINPTLFSKFVESLLGSPILRHPVLRELTRGFTATSLVLLQRSGALATELAGLAPDLEALATEPSRAMPTL